MLIGLFRVTFLENWGNKKKSVEYKGSLMYAISGKIFYVKTKMSLGPLSEMTDRKFVPSSTWKTTSNKLLHLGECMSTNSGQSKSGKILGRIANSGTRWEH